MDVSPLIAAERIRLADTLALCSTLCGRRAFLDQLSGDGLAVLSSRL